MIGITYKVVFRIYFNFASKHRRGKIFMLSGVENPGIEEYPRVVVTGSGGLYARTRGGRNTNSVSPSSFLLAINLSGKQLVHQRPRDTIYHIIYIYTYRVLAKTIFYFLYIKKK